jgi:hypothetical protein
VREVPGIDRIVGELVRVLQLKPLPDVGHDSFIICRDHVQRLAVEVLAKFALLDDHLTAFVDLGVFG